MTRRRRTRPLVVSALLLALALQNAWWLQDPEGRLAILAEGRMSRESNTYSLAAARWLKDHYDGGGILLDESARGNVVLLRASREGGLLGQLHVPESPYQLSKQVVPTEAVCRLFGAGRLSLL
ncbi:hypothetical protein AB0299_21290 [Pseudarthrobacter sp. NPDC080037]|uniref:hypothetical protein n=1 Tax=Pseudarthrobacter sp. NPDC080037 TaxID=3155289 RepID=UPI003450F930